jgi:GNAT superfamily N-acetyltransferase
MARIVVVGADLILHSRIDAQLAALGHDVTRARAPEIAPPADVAICDVEAVDPHAAVAALRPARLLGYGSHVLPEALRAARGAGFDRVVARSAIAERSGALVDELLAVPSSTVPPEPAPPVEPRG